MTVGIERYKVKYLGLDFGSSRSTAVAILDTGEAVELLFKGTMNTETLLVDDGDGYRLCKQGEDLRGLDVQRDVKESFCENDPEKTARMGDFVRLFLDRITEYCGPFDFSELKTVCFGHPGYYNNKPVESYCSIVRDAVREKFGIDEKRISWLSEPELAAGAFVKNAADIHTYEGKTILLLDFGGHTMDTVLIRVRNGVAEVISAPFSAIERERLRTGKELTVCLCEQIHTKECFDNAVEDVKKVLFDAGDMEAPTNSRHLQLMDAGFRLRYGQMSDKAVSTDEEGVILVNVNAAAGFDKVCSRTANLICELVASTDNLDYVLFCGGASKIPPLRGKIMSELKMMYDGCGEVIADKALKESKIKRFVPMRSGGGTLSDRDISSDNLVALGAAIYAKEAEALQNRKKQSAGSSYAAGAFDEDLIKENKALRSENQLMKLLLTEKDADRLAEAIAKGGFAGAR